MGPCCCKGIDSSYSKHWLQWPALGLLKYFWNEWEWQQVLPVFHLSFHTPWLNGKCWNKTAAMFLGSLFGRVQPFSYFVSPLEYRISSLFICHDLWFFIPYFHFPLFLSPCLIMDSFFLFYLLLSCFSLSLWISLFFSLCILYKVKQFTTVYCMVYYPIWVF